MAEAGPHVLIAGVSTRALAVSAARAGYRVTVADAFGDQDLRAVADVLASPSGVHPRFSPGGAAERARSVAADLVAYTANFENHPDAVAALAQGRRLLGNTSAVLRNVRNPVRLMRALMRRDLPVPESRGSAPSSAADARRWLLKPRRSGGGHGTVTWRPGQRVTRRHYLQERIAGVPGSIVFVADGRTAVPLGLSRQLVGLREFGASGFRYCGSMLASAAPVFATQTALLRRAIALASAVTEEFGLRGLNGVDFVARQGVPFPIEVNPRYAASMELVERATGVSLFALHADACAGRLGPAAELPTRVYGKAIVYARRDVLVTDPIMWQVADLADIPHPGERIGRGHPICTVLAEADNADDCVAALVRSAAAVYRGVVQSARGAA